MTEASSPGHHLWLHLTSIGGGHDANTLRIVRGEDCFLYDEAGREYLDALAGNFCVQVGYSRQELVRAATDQMAELPFVRNVGMTAPVTLQLADRLAELSGMERVFFTSGGSEAVETAMKLARQYYRLKGQPGRYKFIARRMAYHGATLGSLALNGVASLKAPYEPLVPGVSHVAISPFHATTPGPNMDPVQLMRDALEFEDPSTVAAIVLEPVQVTGGPLVPMPGYLQGIRSLCDEYGVLLISDEVVNAFGRLGDTFAYRFYDFRPDMVTVAKGLTSGYMPAGATLVSGDISSTFASSDDFFRHILTYGGHPVACAVALENLSILEREGLNAHSTQMGERLREALGQLNDLRIVGAIRGVGLLVGVEMVSDQERHLPVPREVAELVARRLVEEGLITRVDTRGHPIIQISPPLICEQRHIDRIAETLLKVLSEAQETMDPHPTD
jgi:adenosylmethionine-8-amino-7-oxononanoate aminotransferase